VRTLGTTDEDHPYDLEHMGGGGPQGTRIPQNPVGTSGIDDGPGGRAPTPASARPGALRAVGLLAPPLALMGLIWFLSAQPDLSSGLKQDFVLRKAAHVTEFALLTVLWARAIAGFGRGAARRAAPLTGAAIALAWAAVDERHQHFVQGRVGAAHDVAIDAIGIVLAVAFLRWTPVGARLLGRRPDPPVVGGPRDRA
jgi:VanZ family protein